MAETTMTTISSPNTGDKYTHIHHKSGLEILVCEMEGFSTTEAMFGTKYGSINTQFKTAADKDYCTVPEGIAHFLEHKLFENEDCDVFDLYAKTGRKRQCVHLFRQDLLFLQLLRQLQGIPEDPAFLCPVPVLHAGKRRQGTGHHRAGDPDVRRRSGLACVLQYAVRSVPENTRYASTSPAPSRALPRSQTICCTAATAPSTISTTWCWRLPETALWMRYWKWQTVC